MMLKLLATADLHIGRSPTRLADEDARHFSAARMWEAIVERAMREEVAAVLLAGDVVDRENRFFEAAGPLERGVRRLYQAGIRTFAVAGNHDWDVLPRIQKAVGGDALHVLGHGGKWGEALLEREGRAVVRLQGWSFPSEHVRTSPLDEYRAPDDDGLPTIGLLHCDLNQPTSVYAPVVRTELKRQPLTLWVLGHIHASIYDDSAPGPRILYPGSPQAMHPGETGRHGPWLIEVRGMRDVQVRQLCLSRVRYEAYDVDLSGVGTIAEGERRIVDQVRQALSDAVGESEDLARLVLRLRFVGRTRLGTQLAKLGQNVRDYAPTVAQAMVLVDAVTDDTRPEIDLASRSRRHDLTGALARLLLQLETTRWEESDPELQRLVSSVHSRLEDVYASATYAGLAADPRPDREAIHQRLSRQAWRLLERLLEQEPAA